MTPKELIERAKKSVENANRRIAEQEIKDCSHPFKCGYGGHVCANCIEAETINEARETVAIAAIESMGYVISYNPPPIPMRHSDWQFHHDSFDGPGDPRCGLGACPQDCLERIADIEYEIESDD